MAPRPLADLPPSSWGRNPQYVIDLEPLPFRVRAEAGGSPLIDSGRALVMFELGHAPVYYVPRDEPRMERLRHNDHSSHCPYKGDASYWDLVDCRESIANVVWSYEDPYPEMARLKDLIGLYWGKMDAWYHGDRKVSAPVEIAGRINEANNFAKSYPDLAAEWHAEKNIGLQPYEFAADSATMVWWRDASGREWRDRFMDRVLSLG